MKHLILTKGYKAIVDDVDFEMLSHKEKSGAFARKR